MIGLYRQLMVEKSSLPAIVITVDGEGEIGVLGMDLLGETEAVCAVTKALEKLLAQLKDKAKET